MPLHIPLQSMPTRRSGKSSSRWSRRLSRRCSRRQSPGRWRKKQEPCCQEEQSRLNFSAIEGSDPNSYRFQVSGFRFQVRVDREDEIQEKKTKKESFPRDSKSPSKSKLGEGVEKQMLIVGETNF